MTKDELRAMGFTPWYDKSERDWTLDGDRVMYDFVEQALYDADEVRGNHVKLCVVKDSGELEDLIYSCFSIDINEYKPPCE